MAKKKVYAVKKGRQTGLFDSWEACRGAVDGYPGAEFKSFASEEEANVYLGKDSAVLAGAEDGRLIAYVDGSFDAGLGRYSFGCVLLTPEGEIVRKSGSGSRPESLVIRNVAGEMLGAMFAARWAVEKGYPALELRYDYEGIEKWALGKWKAKNELTQKYAEFMGQMGRLLQLSYQKVKAHSGDFYNEEADQLAKAALTETEGIPSVKD